MADAASKPRRTPERAAQVLDRAAKMQQFRPGFLDRRLFDTQMRTPGAAASPFGMNNLDPSLLKGRGEQMIPISKVRSEQPTVSLAAAKSKLNSPAGSSRLPQLVSHNGTYWVADGNHRITAARALGETHIRAQVADLNAQIKGSLINPGTVTKGLRVAGHVAGPMAIVANTTMAWAAAKNAGKSDAGAALDATTAGTRTAATGIAIGTGVKAATVAGLKGAALLGRAAIPLSIAGHAAAYAFQSWKQGDGNLDVLKAAGRGAINGVVPIDMTTQALASLRQPRQQQASAPVGGDTRLSTSQAQKFASADARFSSPAASAGGDDGNKKRGTQNASNLEAIIAARKSRAANPTE